MIVDNNYNKFNINKMSRSGSNSSSTSGTVYLGSGNKITQNIASLDPHYLWGNLFDGTQDINGDIDFTGNITFTGDADGYHGKVQALEGIFNNLTVLGAAHFFELVIDKIKSIGGAIILSPADGFEIIKISTVTNGIKLYFLAESNGEKIDNLWQANDQLLIMDFNNATVGNNPNISNRYFWGLVTSVDNTPEDITIDGDTISAHYVIVSNSTYDGTLPDDYYIGANCVQLGNRSDTTRDGAIYISAYNGLDTGLTAPFIAIYDGINDFNLTNHRQTWFSMNGSSIKGELHVYDNANERVDISPTTLGIIENYGFKTYNQTVIGVDGIFSGKGDKYFWNGPGEIRLACIGGTGTNQKYNIIKVDDTGVYRYDNAKVSDIADSSQNSIVHYGFGDISNTVTVRRITDLNTNNNQNHINLSRDDGFVVVDPLYNQPNLIAYLHLPAANTAIGSTIHIKSMCHCFIYSSSNVIGSHSSTNDGAYQNNGKQIDNREVCYMSDGINWYEMFLW